MHARENQKRWTKRMITMGKAMAGNNSEGLRLSAPMMVVVVGIVATAWNLDTDIIRSPPDLVVSSSLCSKPPTAPPPP